MLSILQPAFFSSLYIQWNLNNLATYGPGFIGRNNEVAIVQLMLA